MGPHRPTVGMALVLCSLFSRGASTPPPAKLLGPRTCVHSGEQAHERSPTILLKPFGAEEKMPSQMMTAGEQAMLISKKYQEIGGNQHHNMDRMDRLKARMLARLQGHVLVETTLRFHQEEEVPSGEIALVGSWAQWVMLHGMEKVADKVWELSLNLPPGMHQFKFLVNGRWRLSRNYRIVDDAVGTDGNNCIEVLAPDVERGGEVLKELEQWLHTVGLSKEVLDQLVEAWLYKNCPC